MKWRPSFYHFASVPVGLTGIVVMWVALALLNGDFSGPVQAMSGTVTLLLSWWGAGAVLSSWLTALLFRKGLTSARSTTRIGTALGAGLFNVCLCSFLWTFSFAPFVGIFAGLMVAAALSPLFIALCLLAGKAMWYADRIDRRPPTYA